MGHSVPTAQGTLSTEDYVVVETAFFGAPGTRIQISPDDFAIRINGKARQFPHVDASLKVGIAYLSEDRKGKGLLLAEDLRVNLTLASLDKFRRWLQIDRAKERVALDRAIGEFDIRAGRKDHACQPAFRRQSAETVVSQDDDD